MSLSFTSVSSALSSVKEDCVRLCRAGVVGAVEAEEEEVEDEEEEEKEGEEGEVVERGEEEEEEEEKLVGDGGRRRLEFDGSGTARAVGLAR